MSTFFSILHTFLECGRLDSKGCIELATAHAQVDLGNPTALTSDQCALDKVKPVLGMLSATVSQFMSAYIAWGQGLLMVPCAKVSLPKVSMHTLLLSLCAYSSFGKHVYLQPNMPDRAGGQAPMRTSSLLAERLLYLV